MSGGLRVTIKEAFDLMSNLFFVLLIMFVFIIYRCANTLERYFQAKMKEIGLWDK